MEYEDIIAPRPRLVIDTGSGYTKMGFVDLFNPQSEPQVVFPTVLGFSKSRGAGGHSDVYVGESVEKNSRYLRDIHSPIKDGVIKEMDDMYEIWNHCFTNELGCKPEDCKVILTELPLTSNEYREKMAEIMFFQFQVPALLIANEAVLSAYSVGKTTGLVCESGYDLTHCVPVFDGISLHDSVVRMELGGKKIEEYTCKNLGKFNPLFMCPYNYSDKMKITKNFIEQCCYAALDYDKEYKTVEEVVYKLPNDQYIIKPKEDRINAAECLFSPILVEQWSDEAKDGLHKCAHKSIQKCDSDKRKALYENIILGGGTSMFNGLKERLQKEVAELAPDSMKSSVNVIAMPQRKFSAFIGGCAIGKMDTFNSMCITREEYEEQGANIFDKKCF